MSYVGKLENLKQFGHKSEFKTVACTAKAAKLRLACTVAWGTVDAAPPSVQTVMVSMSSQESVGGCVSNT